MHPWVCVDNKYDPPLIDLRFRHRHVGLGATIDKHLPGKINTPENGKIIIGGDGCGLAPILLAAQRLVFIEHTSARRVGGR